MHAGRIHKNDLGILLGQDADDAVTGRLRLGRDDRHLLAHKGVGKGGFARIGRTHQRYPSTTCLLYTSGERGPFSRKVPSPPSNLSINTNQNQLHDIAEALLEGGELHAGVGEFGDAGALALDDFGGGAADETLVGELLVEACLLYTSRCV